MNWRKEVTREELLEANDTQYESIVKLEQEVENLKRERGNLLIKIKNVESDVDHYSDRAKEWEEEYTHASQSRDFYEGKWKEAKLENAGLEEHVNYLHKVSNSKEAKLKKEIDRLDSVLTQRTQIIENNNEDFERVDDAAEYWKSSFEDLYNHIIISTQEHGDMYTDGEVLDLILDKTLTYAGESDNLIK